MPGPSSDMGLRFSSGVAVFLGAGAGALAGRPPQPELGGQQILCRDQPPSRLSWTARQGLETSVLLGWYAEDRLTVQPDSEAASFSGRSVTAGSCASTVSVLFACSWEAAASSCAPAWVYAWADCSHASCT